MKNYENHDRAGWKSHDAKLSFIVYLGLALLVSVIIGVGFAAKYGMRSYALANEWVAHTNQVEAGLNAFTASLVNAESGQRGYLYTGRETFLDSYGDGVRTSKNQINMLRSLIRDNPAQLARLAEVENLSARKYETLAYAVDLKKAGRDRDARMYVDTLAGKDIMDSIRSRINNMTAEEKYLMTLRKKTLDEAEHNVNMIMLAGGFITVLTALSFFMAMRRVISRLQENVTVISTSSSEIAATVSQHERASEQQAASVSETTVTVNQLNTSSRQNAQHAEATAAAAQHAAVVTGEGVGLANRAFGGMSGIKEKVSDVAQQIFLLSDQVSQIGGIASLVGELASETNMLALNAAVESARAGEKGRGFAVIADEIRKLADQSKHSVTRVSHLVEEIQKATNSAVSVTQEGNRTVEQVALLAQQAGDAFASLTAIANDVYENAQQMKLNSNEQAAALAQVSQAMKNITLGSSETVAGIAQTKIGVQRLNQVAQSIKESV